MQDEELADVVFRAMKSALRAEEPSTTKEGFFRGRCFNCNKVGHMARDCCMKKTNKPRAQRDQEEEHSLN